MNRFSPAAAARTALAGATGFLLCALLIGYDTTAAREEPQQFSQHREGWLAWNDLDAEEWQRFQQHRAYLGTHMEQLTPYEVLGVYTDDAALRQRYARQNAQFMLDMHRRMNAFEDLYRTELTRLAQQ